MIEYKKSFFILYPPKQPAGQELVLRNRLRLRRKHPIDPCDFSNEKICMLPFEELALFNRLAPTPQL